MLADRPMHQHRTNCGGEPLCGFRPPNLPTAYVRTMVHAQELDANATAHASRSTAAGTERPYAARLSHRRHPDAHPRGGRRYAARRRASSGSAARTRVGRPPRVAGRQNPAGFGHEPGGASGGLLESSTTSAACLSCALGVPVTCCQTKPGELHEHDGSSTKLLERTVSVPRAKE
jgi:hypothetical protein